jgi:hypothetical protein
MKNLHQPQAQQDILQRINALTPTTQRQWGTLTVQGMMAHCTDQLRVATNQKQLKSPPFLLGLMGRIIIYPLLWGISMGKNAPTAPELDQNKKGIKAQDFETEKNNLIQMINTFITTKNNDTPHPFFGKLTQNQWSRLAYVHLNHHLTQFGV